MLNNTLVSAHHIILKLAKSNNEQILVIERAEKFKSDDCLIKSPLGMGKTKLFAAFTKFYLLFGLYILMTRLMDMSADDIDEQLSKLMNNFFTLNLKL